MSNHSGGGTPMTDRYYAGRTAIRDDKEFARTLERELSAAQSALAEKEREVERMKAASKLKDDVIALNFNRAELAEARAKGSSGFCRTCGRVILQPNTAYGIDPQAVCYCPPASPAGRKE